MRRGAWRTIARRIEATGRKFVDAPVSGGVTGAKGGTLTIMASGKKDVFDGVQPVLRAMGSNLFYLGDKPGQGAAMKTVNQLMCGVHIAVAAEALAFAEQAGIDPKLALEILSGSAAQSWMLKARGPRMVEDDGVVTSAVDIFVKDLGIVLDAGRSMKMGLPLAATAHQLFLSASGGGHGSKDDSQVVETYRALRSKGESRVANCGNRNEHAVSTRFSLIMRAVIATTKAARLSRVDFKRRLVILLSDPWRYILADDAHVGSAGGRR